MKDNNQSDNVLEQFKHSQDTINNRINSIITNREITDFIIIYETNLKYDSPLKTEYRSTIFIISSVNILLNQK